MSEVICENIWGIEYNGKDIISNGFVAGYGNNERCEMLCDRLYNALINNNFDFYIAQHVGSYPEIKYEMSEFDKIRMVESMCIFDKIIRDYPHIYSTNYKQEIVEKVIHKCNELFEKAVKMTIRLGLHYRILIQNLCEFGMLYYKFYKPLTKLSTFLVLKEGSCNGCFMDLLVGKLSCGDKYCERCWKKIGRKCPKCAKIIKEKLNFE